MMKNCLVFLKNKKINKFELAENIISSFSDIGLYFDSVIILGYEDSLNIRNETERCVNNYENIFFISPSEMSESLKKFLSSAVGGEFDEFGFLNSGPKRLGVFLSDSDNTQSLNKIKEFFKNDQFYSLCKGYVKTVGAPSGLVYSAIEKAKKLCPETDFGVYEKFGETKIEIIYGKEIEKARYDEALRLILSELNGYVYAIEDDSLENRLFQLLKLRKLKISVAESFTGGGIGKRLVDIPGISEVYFEGLNTYSNESKEYRLGVDRETIKYFGAVSEETAYKMAEGLINTGNCDICIATTGIAGPKSDNTKKPVGLIYIAVGMKDSIEVFKYNLLGDRETITQTAINIALFLAIKALK